jgi:hypothetical protein
MAMVEIMASISIINISVINNNEMASSIMKASIININNGVISNQ